MLKEGGLCDQVAQAVKLRTSGSTRNRKLAFLSFFFNWKCKLAASGNIAGVILFIWGRLGYVRLRYIILHRGWGSFSFEVFQTNSLIKIIIYINVNIFNLKCFPHFLCTN
jgi:hypothetical protein